MHDLLVPLDAAHLGDVVDEAAATAKEYFGATPHDLISSTAVAVSGPDTSKWSVQFLYRGRRLAAPPGAPAHELTFRLKDSTLHRAHHRALSWAATYYDRMEHVLVKSEAHPLESDPKRFAVAFTFMGMAT